MKPQKSPAAVVEKNWLFPRSFGKDLENEILVGKISYAQMAQYCKTWFAPIMIAIKSMRPCWKKLLLIEG